MKMRGSRTGEGMKERLRLHSYSVAKDLHTVSRNANA